MTSRISPNYSAFLAVATAAAVASLVVPLWIWIRVAIAAAYLISAGIAVGDAALPDEPPAWRAFFGTLCFLAATIAAGAALYYVADLGMFMTALLIVGMAIAAHGCRRFAARSETARASSATPKRTARDAIGLLLAAIASALAIEIMTLLAAAATEGSIRSPWDVAPKLVFVIFFIAVLGAFAAAWGDLAPSAALVPLALLAFVATTVAAFVYAIGFGFDPFIHHATEAAILAHGSISPKPLYYLGHYALVTVLARLLAVAPGAIDTFVAPVAFALAAPCAYWSVRRAFGWSAAVAAAASFILLLLPLSPFVPTTPQGFADAVFLITAFLALADAFPRPLLFLLAAAAAAIHPLAGIPLVVFLALRSLLAARKPLAAAAVMALGMIALPVLFLLHAKLSGVGATLDAAALGNGAAIIETLQPAPTITRQYMAVFDFVYSWKAIRNLALLAAGLAGAALLFRKKKTALAYPLAAAVLLANWALLNSVVRFPFLISYERSNYADRLFELAVFLLAPCAAAAFGMLLLRARESFPTLRIGVAVLVAALATSSLYLAYPRRDKYESSRGWSTSAADVETVRRIDADAAGADYVVLSDQAVSAAAVREFGFKKYYPSRDAAHPGLLFFYPIPTGDILYQNFLDMNDAKGAESVARAAMNETGANTVYYVVSYYWWDALPIIVSAKREADGWWSVRDKDFVFKYVRKP